ncbi:MAG: MFS transporter [Clostridiales Family XIII bacterium]|jgi:MFS family permease|nr:MFS transporter [Clostridiales Family XIII bacterium]
MVADVRKTTGILFTLAVVIMGLQDAAMGPLVPVMAQAIAAYQDQVSIAWVQALSSIPTFMPVVIAPIFTRLLNALTRRQLAIIGLAIYAIGGTAGIFCGDTYMSMFVTRVILGFGVGICLPLSLVLVSDFFTGSKRDTVMGWHMACAMIGGILFQVVAGFIATASGHWYYAFLAYMIPVLVLIYELIFLPEPTNKTSQIDNSGGKKDKIHLPGVFFFLLITYFIHHMTANAMLTNNSVVVSGWLGDIQGPAASGISLSLMAGGAFLGALVFGRMKKIFKDYVMVYIFVGFIVGHFIIIQSGTDASGSLTMFNIGVFVSGWGVGSVAPGFYAYLPEVVNPKAVGLGMSLLVACDGFGKFSQSFIYNPIAEATGHTIGMFPHQLALYVFVGLAVVWFIKVTFFKTKKIEMTASEAG